MTRFFAAIATEKPSRMRTVRNLVAHGSLAEAYLNHEYNVTLADVQAGDPLDPSSFTHTDDTYRACNDNGDSGRSCATWGNVRAQGNKIASFTVAGKSLRNRLSVGSGKTVPIGSLGVVKFLTAYQSVQSGALFVAVKLKAGNHALDIDQSDSAYLTPKGIQVTAAEVEGPSTLLAHAIGNYYLAFKGAPPGGRLVLKVFDDDNFNGASATIATR